MSEWWTPTIGAESGPKFLAILHALSDDIRSGRPPPGARLPPQRLLAERLCVDLSTVTRAFTEARRQGLIEATAGRGSFVRGAARRPVRPIAPGASIDFSMNMPPHSPAARLTERMSEALARLAAEPGFPALLQYQDSAGTRLDRETAAEWLGRRLGPVPARRLVAAAGAQAALSAILAYVLGPGEAICAPALTYPGLRLVAERRGLRLLPVAADARGILPEALEECCRQHAPRALYLVPNLDNPTTATLPAERREAVARIARDAGLAIIEDDAYSLLACSPPPPLFALAPDLTWHVATLSKCVTPALRIAYVAAPGPAEASRLTAELRAISLMAPPLNAAIASAWMADGTLDSIVAAIRDENGLRQALAARLLRGLDVAGDPDGPHL